MKTKISSTTKIAMIVVTFLQLAAFTLSTRAQSGSELPGKVNITIEGTSNIHDWTMTSDKGQLKIQFQTDAENIFRLTFSVPSSTIKSESKAMDKNAYKALKTEKFPSITFTSSVVSVKPNGSASLNVTAKGNLTISGVTKPVLLIAAARINTDRSITYTGSLKLKMTDFNVEPPSIMMGAIRTGNEIVIKYTAVVETANYQTKN